MTLCDAGKASLAYFYFDFRDIDKQNLRNLLPSLLIQLSAQSDPMPVMTSSPRLYSAFLTHRPVSLHDESGQKEDIADYVASFVHSDL